jgi:hypothetical protein
VIDCVSAEEGVAIADETEESSAVVSVSVDSHETQIGRQ